ncbi:MAG TPA: hypothetical protein VK447_16430 [Myxococcaceae bacterium]|nr:hypothetical protein [Myxococcaceae bacterium]
MATRKATKTTRRSTAKGTKSSGRAKTSTRSKASTGKKSTRRKTAAKRTLIEPNKGDKRYVRRNKSGQFKEQDNVGRSISMDMRRKAKKKAPKGQGDRGD